MAAARSAADTAAFRASLEIWKRERPDGRQPVGPFSIALQGVDSGL
jgi:hypothetical protein